ncbi:MAG: hypothetical protein RL123_1645, partial [Pseudomonadota bacterium]
MREGRFGRPSRSDRSATPKRGRGFEAGARGGTGVVGGPARGRRAESAAGRGGVIRAAGPAREDPFASPAMLAYHGAMHEPD